MRTGHLSVQQGKWVIVHLRNGGKLIAKFKERKGRTVHFTTEEGQKIDLPTDSIRTLSIYKEKKGS